VINLEICSNTEWVCNHELNAWKIDGDGGSHDETIATILCDAIQAEFLSVDWIEIDTASGQRSTYHGWNGKQFTTLQFGIIATWDRLTESQIETIYKRYQAALDKALPIINRLHIEQGVEA
jgi:hypothetical protein